jgi:hypothetical protein
MNVLCQYDLRDATQRAAALSLRDAEVPFVATGVHSLQVRFRVVTLPGAARVTAALLLTPAHPSQTAALTHPSRRHGSAL